MANVAELVVAVMFVTEYQGYASATANGHIMDNFAITDVVNTVWRRQEEYAMEQAASALLVAKKDGLDSSALRLVARTVWAMCATELTDLVSSVVFIGLRGPHAHEVGILFVK